MEYLLNGEPFDFEGGEIVFDENGKLSKFDINGAQIIEENPDTIDDPIDVDTDDATDKGHGDENDDDDFYRSNLIIPNAKLLTIPFYENIDRYRKQTLPGGIIQAPNGIESILYSLDFTKPALEIAGGHFRCETMGGYNPANQGPNLEMGGIYQFSWQLLTSTKNKPSKTHIGFQLHGNPDKNDQGKRIESYRNPTIGMYSDGLGGLQFYCNYDPNELKITKGKPRTTRFANVNTKPGTWVDIDYIVKISYKMDVGWAQAFIGGEKVGKQYEGATTWNDDKICYYKMGIYFWNAVFNAMKESRAWPKYGNQDERLPDGLEYRIKNFAVYRLPDNYKV